MEYLWIPLAIVALAAAAVLIGSYICFRMAFYVPEKNKKPKGEFDIPQGRIYEPYRDQIVDWIKQTRALPCEPMTITSFDGLQLQGTYYEYAPGAVIEIMFHGYRGSSERDMSGGVQRCFKLGHSALIVDQRSSGRSQGNVITFGVNESRDCLAWMNHAIERFGPDCRLMLTGISMGAATVMIAAGEELPENVIGVLADCGYSSARDIIKTVIRQMKLPANLLYPFVKLGARLYGHFDLEKYSPEEALKPCKVPVLLFHGEDDDFVPCSMSHENFAACASRKKLVTVPGAGHGLCIIFDPEGYRSAMKDFFGV
jgi:fermentation-respiration switch protein FrsA (DUF1100 family)